MAPADPHRSDFDHISSFNDKLRRMHEEIATHYAFVDRVALALYDAKTDLLKTFAHSTRGPSPLVAYQARLSETPSLLELARSRRRRVTDDLAAVSADRQSEHTRRIVAGGYRSSYTAPIFIEGQLLGFVFFDSMRLAAFSDHVLPYLDLFGHLISLVIANEMTTVQTLLGTVRVARSFSQLRDVETGGHLERMSRYARLIAAEVGPTLGRDDEFVEHVFMFAPLHDIGKIGIPDSILLKPSALTPEEDAIMRTHVSKGCEIIDRMLGDFGLRTLPHVDILLNVVRYHHETVDGLGYPEGLRGDQIPLETRIIIVADVFDALTSRRPYKPAWNNDVAFAEMNRLAETKLDRDCVAALGAHRTEVEELQERFREIPYP